MGILQDVVIGTVGREHHHDSNGPEDSHWTGLQAYAEYGQHPTYAFAFKPMTTTTAAILDRLEALETDLEAQRGYIKALEYGVRALIITHLIRKTCMEVGARCYQELLTCMPATAAQSSVQPSNKHWRC